MVCLKGCLPQISLGPFLNTLTHLGALMEVFALTIFAKFSKSSIIDVWEGRVLYTPVERQLFADALQHSFVLKFRKFQHRCFLVKFAKFLRTSFFTEHLR